VKLGSIGRSKAQHVDDNEACGTRIRDRGVRAIALGCDPGMNHLPLSRDGVTQIEGSRPPNE
jgi:hypothetical protein